MKKELNLSVKEVAALLQIPVVKIQRWVYQGQIPCKFKGNDYYFKEKDILKWAKSHGMIISKGVEGEENVASEDDCTLKKGIENGGVFFNLEGDDTYSVIKNAVEKIDFPEKLDRNLILNELISREEIASTGIGRGVAIPHTRRELDLKFKHLMVPIFFLKNRIDFNSLDGQSVFVLFFIFSPSAKVHLKLLSRLSYLLRDKMFLDNLKNCKNKEELISLIEKNEKRFENN